MSWDQDRTDPVSQPIFNYIDRSVPHSLFRNGRVSLSRDAGGDDSGLKGYIPDAQQMVVTDARTMEGVARPTLARNGFDRLDHPLPPNIDFLDHGDIVRRYYPACVELMKTATGAEHVFAFDHNVRWAEGQREHTKIQGGQQVQGPIRVVHGDYTLTSGPQRLRDLAQPPRINDTMRPFLDDGESLIDADLAASALESGRFAFVNVWRNVAAEPIQKDPLAFVDAQTVSPRELVVFELHYADRIGENYFAHHSDRHRWFYYSELLQDEAVLIKQWDSAGAFAVSTGDHSDEGEERCTMNFHSAFEDPATQPDAPERHSIEVRCALVY